MCGSSPKIPPATSTAAKQPRVLLSRKDYDALMIQPADPGRVSGRRDAGGDSGIYIQPRQTPGASPGASVSETLRTPQ